MYKTQVQGTAPLYRYYSNPAQDHFYTMDYRELGQAGRGYNLERIEAYAYPSQVPGTARLYRYFYDGHHFYTTNYNEMRDNGREPQEMYVIAK